MTKTTPLALLLATTALVLSACGTTDGDAEAGAAATPETRPLVAAPAALAPGDEVPAPEGKVLLTIEGGRVHNVGQTLQLDRALLESLGTVSYEVDDSQATGGRAEFSGPLLRTVLAVAGASGDTLHTVALNDYTVDIPSSDAADLPVMVATRQDGKPMSVARYGPLRLVYPTEGYDLDAATYMPRWIWQLEKVVVR